MRRPLTIALTAATIAVAALSNAQANGTLYFSQDGNGNGLYSINYLTGVATNLGQSGVTSSTVGLTEGPNPNQLLGSSWVNLNGINPDGSGFTTLGVVQAEGLAYHAANGLLYGILNGSFFSANASTGALIANLATPTVPGGGVLDLEGLASAHGMIFGIGGFSDSDTNLWAYNIGTDTWSSVGNTGIDWNLSGLAYDPIGDWLYGIGSQDNNLYRINPFNGATTVVGLTGIQGTTGGGLGFIAAPVPEPATCAALAFGALAMLRRRKSK